MIRFLRLFAAFRQLEAAHEAAFAKTAVLAEAVEIERRRFEAAQAELVATLRLTADAMARQATGRNVFARASEAPVPDPAKPEKEPPKPIVSRRRANQAVIEEHLAKQRRQADEAIKAQGLS